jgi:hypothetical protein
MAHAITSLFPHPVRSFLGELIDEAYGLKPRGSAEEAPQPLYQFKPIRERRFEELFCMRTSPMDLFFPIVIEIHPPLEPSSRNTKIHRVTGAGDLVIERSLSGRKIDIRADGDVIFRNGITLRARCVTICARRITLECEVTVICIAFKMRANEGSPSVEANDRDRWRVSEDAESGRLIAIATGAISSSRK